MNSTSALTTKKLTVTIADKTICHDLDITVNKGECWAVLGQNGTGKTTLLHTLAGLHYLDNGEIYLNDIPLKDLSPREIARQSGLLLQDYQDIFPATVLEAVLIGRHPHLTAWQWESDRDNAIARAALKDVGLDGFSQRSIQTLSGGERRRVAIAAILAQQPELFLLDEPANHLDIKHQHQLLELFSRKARDENNAVIMVLHDINLAARYCDHAILMYAGGQIETGTNQDMFNEEKLSKVFGHPIEQIEAEQKVFMPSSIRPTPN